MILQAMKDALTWMERVNEHVKYPNGTPTITSLRAAIVEMEKAEPVAISEGNQLYWIASKKPPDDYEEDNYLYFHPELAIPEGWQPVPKEPTKEMLDAGDAEIDPGYCEESSSSRFVEDGESMVIYKAMLAAAPEYKS